jgi:phosphoglycerol transferase MdoB-like AlkP superfamily enzyme
MKEKLLRTLLFFVPLSLLFATVSLLLRLYEWWMLPGSSAASYEVTGMLYDLSFSCVLMVVVLILGLLVSLLHVPTGRIVMVSLYGILLLFSFGLVQYFTETHIPLSADLFGYTLQDIKTTMSASAGLNVGTMLFIVLYLGFYIGGVVWLMKKEIASNFSPRVAGIILTVIVLIAGLPIRPKREQFPQELHYNLTISKPRYFVDRAVVYLNENRELRSHQSFAADAYPFLHAVNYNDVLGHYLQPSSSLPNIVFVLVEGLGRDFTGPEAPWGGFTPFLDSLATKSLYWKNGLSNAGRTFGALPSVLGSLPYGKEGFMSYGTKMPDHQTILSLLKPYGYATHFFYGGNPNFDNQDIFLQYQGIDQMLNESNFPPEYTKSEGNTEGFTWGYADRDVLNCSLGMLKTNQVPRVDVYLTLSTHEPFRVPEEKFNAQFAHQLSSTAWSFEKKKEFNDYAQVFSCLLYTDNALREFFNHYRSRPEFDNTIFVITGDHRLIPVPQATRISRFHVPIMIYSPLLKEPHTFESIALHSDIAPSLLAYLSRNYQLTFPSQMPFISDGLTTGEVFGSSAHLALIRNKGEIGDYIDGDHFLSENRLFQIRPNLDLEPMNDTGLEKKLESDLLAFKARSVFACENNRLDKPATKSHLELFTLSDKDKTFITHEHLESLTPDQLFLKARELAFARNYDDSRSVLKLLLNQSPNYHDARILLARTFAWNSEYDTAKFFLKQVLSRAPGYDEAYNASIDIEYWQGHREEALALTEKGLRFNPGNADLLARKARSLWLLGKNKEAKTIVDEVLKTSPQHELALELHQKIRS